MKAPCLNCPDRSAVCHADCAKFTMFNASKLTNKERQRQHMLDDFMFRSIENTKQRRKKK